jgi:hypothetical protein
LMAVAPYFSRATDAIRGVADIRVEELVRLLGQRIVKVAISDSTADQAHQAAGAELLVNLLARLYPAIAIEGPSDVVARCTSIAAGINPAVELPGITATDRPTVSIGYGSGQGNTDLDITVSAAGWTVAVDRPNPAGTTPANSFAALGAACFGAAEVFRTVFADHLGIRGRRKAQPGALDLVSCSDAITPPVQFEGLVLPELHLVGAGAIGQACALALSAADVRGHLTVVDPERIELSNLQRYVLSMESDVGSRKTSIIERSLRSAAWTVNPVNARWGEDDRAGPRQANVLVALDSARDRLGVATGLHDRVFNAFTQPDDLGWSRHEVFGVDPCLGCLYYPDRERPSDDELIAGALNQPRLRVLSYLVTRIPVGFPLPVVVTVADIPAPPEAASWLQTPILDDVVRTGLVEGDQANAWSDRTISQLYSEGICGGAILQFGGKTRDTEAIVPLAQQSAFAGIMLGLQPVIASIPELAIYRPNCVEYRIDLTAGLPQIVPRPRVKTPGCFCSDPFYLRARKH